MVAHLFLDVHCCTRYYLFAVVHLGEKDPVGAERGPRTVSERVVATRMEVGRWSRESSKMVVMEEDLAWSDDWGCESEVVVAYPSSHKT